MGIYLINYAVLSRKWVKSFIYSDIFVELWVLISVPSGNNLALNTWMGGPSA